MYLPEMLEVAIGLVFVWFVISMATIQIQEIIANVFSKRSKYLEKAIKGMLGDPKKVDELYDHPLIKSLSEPSKKPSYIPSNNFAMALFDIVASEARPERSPIYEVLKHIQKEADNLDKNDPKTAKALFRNIMQLGQTAANSKAASDLQEIRDELKKQLLTLGNDYSNLRPTIKFIMETIDKKRLEILFKNDQLLERVAIGANALRDKSPDQVTSLGKAINILLAGIDVSAPDVDKDLPFVIERVENWFNSTMERTGGWYKRWAQTWAFVIGVVMAITMNIDSVNIAVTLWKEPQIRQATNAYVDAYLQEQTGVDPATQQPKLDVADYQEIKNQLESADIPIGWKGNFIAEYFADFGAKTLGFLITGLAAMQGAPFWFDTLKKLVNVRGTGANPAEKTPNAAST